MRSPKVVILLTAVAAAAIFWLPAQDAAQPKASASPVPITQLRAVVRTADAGMTESDTGTVEVDAEHGPERDHAVAEPLLLVAGALLLGIALTVRERRQRRGYT